MITLSPPRRRTIAGAALLALLGLGPPASAGTATSSTISVKDGVLAYSAVGPAPIVLLAGGPGLGVEYLRPVADVLAKTHEVLLPEPRGLGRSRVTKTDASTINFVNYVQDIEALRVAAAVERLILVGHSWGAQWAVAYLDAYPANVRAVVLLDGVYPSQERGDAFMAAAEKARTPAETAALQHWSDPAEVSTDPEKARLERFKAFVPSLFYNHAVGEKFAREFHAEWSSGAVADLMDADSFHLDAVIAGIKGSPVPVLILQGQQDPAGESAAAYKALFPNAEVVMIPQAGHNPWLEQPEAFEAGLLGYLKEKGL
jgi:pimeloyl-ACP methyl ester carboxylesterase